MDNGLIGVVASLLAAIGGAQGAAEPRSVSVACGVKMSLPTGWKVHLEGTFAERCTFELKPPRWRSDPECPERRGGRLYVQILPKRLRVFLDGAQQEWLRASPDCESGWLVGGDGSACLNRIRGRASALSGEGSLRLYCNGTYAASDIGRFGAVFGERRLALVIGDAGDDEVFDRIVGSLRP